PAEPVSLAVLDALPEPGMLGGTVARGREVSVAADAIAAHLAADGVADAEEINEAVTALRVAISETPRRAAVNRALTSAVAETVRQAVASVRACDAGCEALVSALSSRVSTPVQAPGRRAAARRGESVGELTGLAGTNAGLTGLAGTNAGLRSVRPTPPAADPAPAVGRRSRPEPIPGNAPLASPRPLGPPPVAPAPVTPPPVAPAPMTPAAMAGPPPSTLPSRSEPLPSRIDGPTNRPVSAPPPPPPGITPIAPTQRGMVPPAEAGEPFRPTLTTAAINNARAERQRTVIPPRPKTNGEPRPSHLQRPVDEPPTGGFSATDLSIPVPTPRPGQEAAPPGSRANWPLVNNPEDPSDSSPNNPVAYSYGGSRGVEAPTDPGRADGRVTPPWLADDLPPEPPMLRLVEPPPLADRALREGLNPPADQHLETPPLRLVDREQAARNGRAAARTERAAEHRPSPPVEHRPPPMEHRPPPVADEGDGDLLIFAQAKSAWFVGQAEESDLDWSTTADTGWQAAEQAARPAVGAETNAGLPKRVPQANLVPGSPLREERPLRIVRDAASLAENTTGYFRGWRRGQEIGGFAVGGRPGREAAGGWDFSRDHGDRDDDREYEYRSAGYQS
ncbi:transposase, partial [Micromonospora sp. NPDC047753]